MTWIVTLLFLALVFWAVARIYLDGGSLNHYDVPVLEPVNTAPSAENAAVLESVAEMVRAAGAESARRQLARMRQAMDELGGDADLSGLDVTPTTVAGRPAEWITASGAEPAGRLLYLHGGAFTMGSPLSHRVITTELARRTGLAVLAVDYRLMPEHRRGDGIADCVGAYRWILRNGPAGPGPAEALFVAGDSAGGNLTLMLIARVRNEIRAGAADLRQVDGAIALSPLTDATFSSPSLGANADRDPMLGPVAKQVLRFPRPLTLWVSWLQNRIRPSDPRVSPVRDDLSSLPPVLVQASESEILIDDARRYVNKARHAGSPVEIETWHGMVHVWHAFGPRLPETEQAYQRITAFVARILENRGQANAA